MTDETREATRQTYLLWSKAQRAWNDARTTHGTGSPQEDRAYKLARALGSAVEALEMAGRIERGQS